MIWIDRLIVVVFALGYAIQLFKLGSEAQKTGKTSNLVIHVLFVPVYLRIFYVLW